MPMSGPAAPTAGCYNRVVARGTMKDQYGRELSDLRISLTDRCNLRCVYCMPAEGIDFRPAEELLADDVVPLAALTRERPWEVRFIEMMPFGSVGDFAEAGVVKSEEIQARIESGLGPLQPLDLSGGDPARTFRLRDAAGTVGLISPVSQPFCARCGRLRLTADGRLRLCLLRDDEADLLAPLRRGASYDEIKEIFRAAAYRRPFGHALAEKMFPQARVMIQIGG